MFKLGDIQPRDTISNILSCKETKLSYWYNTTKESRALPARNVTKRDFVINLLTNQLSVFDTPPITPLGLTIPFMCKRLRTICAVVIQADSLNYCGVVWVCNSRSGDLENQWCDYYGMVRIQRCLERTYLKKRLKSWSKVSGLCVTCEFLPVGISILRLSKFGSTNWNYVSEAYIPGLILPLGWKFDEVVRFPS